MRDELRSIRKGYTWRDLFVLLWHVATVRYVIPSELKKHFPDALWRKKCGTAGKLDLFASVGLLNKSEIGVYRATQMTINFLESELRIREEELSTKGESQKWREEELRYNPDIISLGKGTGQRDTLSNTEVFLEAIQRRDFFALFYDCFSDKKGSPWLTPDGIMLMRRKGRLGLVFLEIEKKKPEWKDHLEEKRLKYEALAYREWLWSHWWKNKCRLLKIKQCDKEEFGFNVWCIGDITQDNWDGWQFKRSII